MDVILNGAGNVVRPHLLKMVDQSLCADVVEVRREDDLRPLGGENAGGLDEAPVRADDDAKRHPVPLKHRELAALRMKRLVGRALAVAPQQMPFVNHDGRIVEFCPTGLIEADNRGRLEPGREVQQFHCLWGIDRERIGPGSLGRIRVTRQKALGKGDHRDTLAIRPRQPALYLRQIAAQIPRH